MNTKTIGDLSEARVLAAFVEAGKVVLVPWGDNQRYDLVVEEAGRFYRIQVKTGRLNKGIIRFHVCSSYAHRGRGRRDYRGQADFFGVYCPDNNTVYLVPVSKVGSSHASLRISPTENNQSAAIRWAKDFEFCDVTQLAEFSAVNGVVAGSSPAVAAY